MSPAIHIPPVRLTVGASSAVCQVVTPCCLGAREVSGVALRLEVSSVRK